MHSIIAIDQQLICPYGKKAIAACNTVTKYIQIYIN